MKKIDAERITNEIVEFIRDYYKENNLKGAVIGISGGKDSGVVAGLFCKALGPENVLGITLPCHSKSEDRTDALLVSEHFGFKMLNHDLTNTYDAFMEDLFKNGDFTDEERIDADINIKPRLRTATLYYYAALYSKLKKGTYIVAGTGNKCEIYVGYFTKGGDGMSDIQTIADLTVDEVIAVGEYLGVPDKVIHKAPNDGLSGKTDEEKLGVKYKEVADYMEDPELVSPEVGQKILRLHNNSLHKFHTPTYRKRA